MAKLSPDPMLIQSSRSTIQYLARPRAWLWLALWLFTGLGACFAQFDENLARLPQMAPEKCALQPPDILLARLMKESPPLEGIGDCESCVDRFYETYAVQLARKTEEDHPEAQKFRGALLECFEMGFSYLAEIHHKNGLKHYARRISGELAWIIFRGAQQQHSGYTDFGKDDILGNAWLDDESVYTPALIEQIALAIGKANAIDKADNFELNMRPILDRTLTLLATAEAQMNEDQKLYFRRYLVLFITRFP
jgi:hypothetical protein